MKRNIIYIFILFATLLLSSCNQDLEFSEEEISNSQLLNSDDNVMLNIKTDVIRIKFTETMASKIENQLHKPNGFRSPAALDNKLKEFVNSIGAENMTRVFPYAGKYEKRQRKEGLHLWYDINIKNSNSPMKSLARAMEIASQTKGVEIVEQVQTLKTPTKTYTLADEKDFQKRSLTNMFNDPKLNLQWHYHNDGSLMKAIKNADINLFEAWKIETGKPNVIVAIVDGGIDTEHEDLKENVYINALELNGAEGVDDDNNGFVDDIYGYNFALNKGKVIAHSHGTHVSGTVAARNNNGIGVAGVAGGNGTQNSGVKLISCQIFSPSETEGRDVANGSAAAIVYGANNGAVISQNSWGYSYQPGMPPRLVDSEREAIDYFIKYAGCDAEGNQLPNSPMKGGVVIFAAGNDGLDVTSYPAAYEKVISVSSMSYDFSSAPYTNRGDWVSIMAPGGNVFNSKGQILSTLPENKYGYMQGTSMACPHVSGIAALIVSKFGKQGFTNDELKSRLISALRPYDINANNPQYAQRLGVGYIDAARALDNNQNNKKPNNVENVSTQSTQTGIEVMWSVASDANDGTALYYNIYYSTEKISKNNYKDALTKKIQGIQKLGEKVIFNHTGLHSNTTYYYAVEAVDRWGAVCESPIFAEGKTLENTAPILNLTNKNNIRLTTGHNTETRIIKVTEADGQKWSYTIDGEDYDTDITRKNDELHLKFRIARKAGKYSINIIVKDEAGLESKINIPFEIYYNHRPIFFKEKSLITTSIDNEVKIKLQDLFSDIDGDELTYRITNLDTNIATAKIVGDELLIKPMNNGVAGVSITATDPLMLSVKGAFTIKISKNDLVNAVYPAVARNSMSVQLANNIQEASISILTQTGKVIMNKKKYKSGGQNSIIELNISHILPGTYMLVVENGNKIFTKTFIKR